MNEKIVVFAYNFPHRKTQEFLVRLAVEEFDVCAVIAADPVKLKISPSTIRTKIRHRGLVRPAELARRLGFSYHVLPHWSDEIIALLQKVKPDLGVIAGARILKKPVINCFRVGVINWHPGLVPEARGLDAMLWSIHKDIPLGVTSHLINEQIDAGWILERCEIPIYEDDTALDLAERLQEIQIEMLPSSIAKALSGEKVPVDAATPYNSKMPAELEKEVLQSLPAYVQRRVVRQKEMC